MHPKQELQQKRAQRAAEVQQIAEEEVDALRCAGKVGRKKLTKSSPTSPTDVKAKNTGVHYSWSPMNSISCTLFCILLYFVGGSLEKKKIEDK